MLLNPSSPSLLAFQQAIEQSSSLLVDPLWDVTKAYLIYQSALTTNKNILLISDGMEEMKMRENLSSFSDRELFEFPSWETLPGEKLSPSPDIIGKRMQILHALLQTKNPYILITSLQSLLQKTLHKDLFPSFIHTWKRGTKINVSSIDDFFLFLGYEKTTVVSDKGQFAKRGGIVDIFVTEATNPYRIEFFGDEIDNIRFFDPVGQKSIQKIDQIFICPAREIDLIKREKKSSLLIDYLKDDFILVYEDLLSIENHCSALINMHAIKSSFFITFDTFWQKTSHNQKLYFSSIAIEKLSPIHKKTRLSKFFHEITFEMFDKKNSCQRFFHSFSKIADFLSFHIELPKEFSLSDYIHVLIDNQFTCLFFYENEREKKIISEKLSHQKLNLENIQFEKGYLSSSFLMTDAKTAFISSIVFTKKEKIERPKWRGTYHTPPAEFFHLEEGDLVVHFHSGIGKYLGIEKQIDYRGKENEFILIEYAEKSKLYVPISQAHLVSKYIGTHESLPPLHALGSTRWQKTKLQAQKQIIGYASELLELYAERSLDNGFAFPPDSDDMGLFELDFPYIETKDQLDAIEAIKQDMTNKKPMDRLICGDVGYGKTEVAMRAAFKAVYEGKKQVALLVPTTVLALQHYETFLQRMMGYPIKIASVSRFNTLKENKNILKETQNGKIDILIGTHRLLSKDVQFHDLGLIIIDEEQRFGVRAKEHLKKLKKYVDCLTLSATPIPRTLYFSLVQARDLSTINSPPQDRLPIKTIIAEEEDELIKNALLRELSRQGQAFVVHNRVDSIYTKLKYLQSLLPQATILVVHGQMKSDDIDHIFHEFKEGRADVLLTTTIIESGIDIPNANTIIIYRADTFGLADLYQLRGRVGRWNKTAYAYLLTPKNRQLHEISKKRLNILLEAGGYGGGMKIAMRDLEIRGAGDILGVKQSGQVSAIGFHLYCKLLKKTMNSLKNKTPTTFIETKIEFPINAKIPENFIPETTLRMEIYYRLGEASSNKDFDDILEEVKDRYGQPPDTFMWLYNIARIRLFASQHQYLLLKMHRHTLYIEKKEGKKIIKKTLLLPHLPHTPHEMERYLIEKLQKVS